MANEYELKYDGLEIDRRLELAGSSVTYTQQNLDEEQKAQARENIGAADANAVNTGTWELIQTIEVEEGLASLTLTEEPDGTPYSFSRMYMLLEVKNTSVGNLNLFYKYHYPNGKDDNIWGTYLSGVSTARDYYSAFEIYPECGYWRARACKWTSNVQELGTVMANDYQYFAKRSLEALPVINGIKISFSSTATFPANSKITIWGVRANA